MTEENIVRNAIIKYIESLGGICTKVFCGRGQLKYGGYIVGATPGTHDLIACIHGKYISIEVKKNEKEVEYWNKYDMKKLPTNKSQERIYNQRLFKKAVEESGGLSCCVGSLQQLRKFLFQRLPELQQR